MPTSRTPGDRRHDLLARRLRLPDAVVIGLGSMIGAGVFVAIGPAAAAGGPALLLGLLLAAAVAYCNATSSAQLAALMPAAGGTYLYGRERLGPVWGYLAGWGFVVGKTASCAAMALTFGAYAAPDAARPLAIAAVVGVVAVDCRGIERTARATRIVVAIVLAALAAIVAAALLGGTATTANVGLGSLEPRGAIEAAGFMFFAFAGYARIATLGEEVVDPARTIPRAIPLALGLTLAVYAAVALAALLAIGPERLAAADAPLAAAARAGTLDWLAPAARVGAAVAALGVLLSLLAGVGRTALAMARDGALPRWLDAVHPRFAVPHRAELAVGAVVIAVVAIADVREAIGFSAFTVLVYYAITNAAAWRLGADERRWPRALAGAGLAGCLTLALGLPAESIGQGVAVLGVGLLAWSATRTADRGDRSGD